MNFLSRTPEAISGQTVMALVQESQRKCSTNSLQRKSKDDFVGRPRSWLMNLF
jgi:hypothetical protein